MFGVESKELLIILFAALILFGPRRIPEIARALGKGLGDIRDALSGIERDVRQAADSLTEPGVRPAAGTGALPATVSGDPPPSTGPDSGPGDRSSDRTAVVREESATQTPGPPSGPGLAG